MASKLQLAFVVLLVATVVSADDAGLDKELQTTLNFARKLLGVRKQLSFGDTSASLPGGSPKPGSYAASPEFFASPTPTSGLVPPAERGASLSDSTTTSGSQSAATTANAEGHKSRSGSTAAAVVGSLLALVVIGVLSVFVYKQVKGKNQNRQRYSTYSTFDNEMGQIR